MSGWGRNLSGRNRRRPYIIVAGPEGRRVGRSSFKDAPTELAITLAVRRASTEEGGPTLPTEAWWLNLATEGASARIVVEEPAHWKCPAQGPKSDGPEA
jgi:hypothetical protein